MKFAMTLPQFVDSVDLAIDAAVRAEGCGLDGVFVFDHLWPMGQRGRPALSALPLLGAVAAATRRITVGTLVARIGLLPDDVLVGELRALASVAPHRVICGLGTGDSKSSEENLACGLGLSPVAERLASMERCATLLLESGLPVWLGGTSSEVLGIARRTGAEVNLWDSGAFPTGLGFSWAGPLRGTAAERSERAASIRDAGARWLVWGWPDSPELVAELRDSL